MYFCSFVFSSNQPQSMLLSNRAGKIELGCYKMHFFHKWINFIVFLFVCLFFVFFVVVFLFLSLKKPGGTVGKNRRYSWLVSVSINRFVIISFLFFYVFRWWWNQYTTSTFRTTSDRYVPLRSCSSFLSSRKKNQLGNPLTCIIKRLFGVQAKTVQQSWLRFTKFH